MNLRHLQTFIWLRYRLRLNQMRRAGLANSIILALIVAITAIAATGFFLSGLGIGLLALPQAPPVVTMLVWDGAIIVYLFSWMVGLLTELQRTDGLSLDKFLHLPVSPAGAFIVNYVSSLFSVFLLLFAAATSGLILGQIFAGKLGVLLAIPLLVTFLLAVTAVTYQFQGWLASLMTNPRRRRTVIVICTLVFVTVFQLPNLVNILRPWEEKNPAPEPRTQFTEQLQSLNESVRKGQITPQEFERQRDEAIQERDARSKEETQQAWAKAERTSRIINTALPPGWLALGASDLAQGSFLPGLLAVLAFGSIGTFSLWRAYRTTLRMYTGSVQTAATKAKAATTEQQPGIPKLRLIEWKLPWIGEQASSVAVAGFQSFIRAPEAKMALIAPIVLVFVFGSMLASVKSNLPAAVRPLMAFGATSFIMLSAIQFIGNQFAYDRAGFRIYVLSPISRKDILLGKNLALAPFVLAMIAMALIALECFRPMRIDRFLAVIVQAVAMYLLFCLMANVVSIISPLPIAAGAMQPSQVKFTQILAHLLLMMAYPLVLAPLLLPLGIEVLASEITGIEFLPIMLPLMLAMLVGVVFIYRYGLVLLGRFLALREQKVLEIVTSKLE